MNRIYFLVPTRELSSQIVDDLLLAMIGEHQIRIVPNRGAAQGRLPEVSVLRKTIVIPAMERGLAIGGITGTLTGLTALALPSGAVICGGALLLASALAGAGFLAWAAGMVGLSVGSCRLKPYEEAIESGQFLLTVDVPRNRVEEIHWLIQQHHPEVEFKGTVAALSALPREDDSWFR